MENDNKISFWYLVYWSRSIGCWSFHKKPILEWEWIFINILIIISIHLLLFCKTSSVTVQKKKRMPNKMTNLKANCSVTDAKTQKVCTIVNKCLLMDKAEYQTNTVCIITSICLDLHDRWIISKNEKERENICATNRIDHKRKYIFSLLL